MVALKQQIFKNTPAQEQGAPTLLHWQGGGACIDPSPLFPPFAFQWSQIPTRFDQRKQQSFLRRGLTVPCEGGLALFLRDLWSRHHEAEKERHAVMGGTCKRCDPSSCGHFLTDGSRCGWDEEYRKEYRKQHDLRPVDEPIPCKPSLRRWKSLVVSWQVMGFDIEVPKEHPDAKTAEGEVRELLEATKRGEVFPNTLAILYSSPSNGTIKGDYPGPRCRWRLFLVLDKPYTSEDPAGDYSLLWTRLRKKIPSAWVDESTKDPTRPWYTPRTVPGCEPPWLFLRLGKPLSCEGLQTVADLLRRSAQIDRDTKAKERAAKALAWKHRASSANANSRNHAAQKAALAMISDIQEAPHGERHFVTMKKVHKLAGLCVAEGLHCEEWKAAAIDAAESRATTAQDKRDAARIVRDAWRVGEASPLPLEDVFKSFDDNGTMKR